jgi:hypothetical protein
MIKYWTPQEDELIIKARLDGTTVRQIKVPGRSTDAVSARYTKLVKDGKIPKLETNYYWTDDEESLLYTELSNSEIAKKIGRSEEAVRYKRGMDSIKLTEEQLIFLKENYTKSRPWLAEQLGMSLTKTKRAMSSLGLHRYSDRDEQYYIELVKKYGTTLNLQKNKDNGDASYNSVINYFGSWSKACEAAGIKYNNLGLEKDKETILYFVDFGEFKKVGITQQSIKARFAMEHRDYVVLDHEVFENLELALSAEREILNKIKNFARADLKSGSSECFYSDCTDLLGLFST